ncbi:hypothetical protein BDZ89DRAFT_1172982 [Hymenopellis radicata]|nr:hypothetical protein BDZ89DRAFT_1172982 [Hymenopellis radicata]
MDSESVIGDFLNFLAANSEQSVVAARESSTDNENVDVAPEYHGLDNVAATGYAIPHLHQTETIASPTNFSLSTRRLASQTFTIPACRRDDANPLADAYDALSPEPPSLPSGETIRSPFADATHINYPGGSIDISQSFFHSSSGYAQSFPNTLVPANATAMGGSAGTQKMNQSSTWNREQISTLPPPSAAHYLLNLPIPQFDPLYYHQQCTGLWVTLLRIFHPRSFWNQISTPAGAVRLNAQAPQLPNNVFRSQAFDGDQPQWMGLLALSGVPMEGGERTSYSIPTTVNQNVSESAEKENVVLPTALVVLAVVPTPANKEKKMFTTFPRIPKFHDVDLSAFYFFRDIYYELPCTVPGCDAILPNEEIRKHGRSHGKDGTAFLHKVDSQRRDNYKCPYCSAYQSRGDQDIFTRHFKTCKALDDLVTRARRGD